MTTAPTPDAPAISLVVSTIGRPDHLTRLVRSLVVEAASVGLELIVADQSPDGSAEAIVAAHAGDAFAWRVVPSRGGASRGRNAGLALARAPIVSFPDDDCWYPGTTLAAVVAELDGDPALAGVTAMLQDGHGRPNMLRWRREPTAVTPANYYRTSIGPTVVARTALVREIGGYVEEVGPGSGTPLGSCEDADVLLRLLPHGPVAYHPELRVCHDELAATLEASVADKLYGYGVGQAWFWRRHRYPWPHVAWLLGRKAAKVALVRTRRGGAAAAPDAAFLRGAIDGLTGRVDVRV